jgi:hypothetical protein
MDSYTPKRTQYIFDGSKYRYKSRTDVLLMQNQWNTFERVENYDDIIFQRITDGYRDKTFYQFVSSEFKDYKAGQQLHIQAYPTLPPTTFISIRETPLPDTPIKSALPYVTNIMKNIPTTVPISAEELTKQKGDLETYMYVSTFNQARTYKYAFTSDEERMAYYRAEKRVMGIV